MAVGNARHFVATVSVPRKGKQNMKILLRIVGAILILMGGVWFLQGIGVLPGSFMSGQMRWAVNGGIAVAVGVLLVVLSSRRR
jgi:hypothetical protein